MTPLSTDDYAPDAGFQRHVQSEPGLDWFNKPRFTNQTELVVAEPFKVNRSAEALRIHLKDFTGTLSATDFVF